METTKEISRGRKWASYMIQAVVVFLFLAGAINNLLQTESAVNGAAELGYPKEVVLYLGLTLLLSTVLYIIPRTSIIGAILLTAWLGGAVATHVIHQDPLFNTLFPVIFGILVWLGLMLRRPSLQGLLSGK